MNTLMQVVKTSVKTSVNDIEVRILFDTGSDRSFIKMKLLKKTKG